MMIRKKQKNFSYYALRLVIAGIFIYLGFVYGPILYNYTNRLPVDDILSQSFLKDRKFRGKVVEVRKDDISAYFMEEHSNPIVSINFSFNKSGTAYENIEKLGIGVILSDMLSAGSGRYDELAFKEVCEELGIKLSFHNGKDNFFGSIAFPSKYKTEVSKLLKDILLKPHFPEDYLNLVKQQMYLAQKVQNENPDKVIRNKFNEFVFAGHPYERNSLGTEYTIQGITTDDLRDFMQKHFTKDNLVIGIVGDLTIDETESFLHNTFSDLSKKSDIEQLSRLHWNFSGAKHSVKFPAAQDISIFVTGGTYRDSVDFYPLYIANYIFGESGLDSRLSKEIREKSGLTYGIYTSLIIDDASALIIGKYSATPENSAKANDILMREWKNFAQNGVTEEELTKAKQSLINSYNLRFADINNISNMLLVMQLYKLGSDFLEKRNGYIKNVTLQEVNAAAKKYFSGIPDFISINVDRKKEH